MSHKTKVSTRWLKHRFLCSLEYIQEHCKGRCCEGSDKIMVSLLPAEVNDYRAAGFVVQDGMLKPDDNTGLCPHKRETGLCAVHGSYLKPFGCIASPFTLNKHDTLIIRYRYSRMKCHGSGLPAYEVFRPSLDMIYGTDTAAIICRQLAAGVDPIYADMPMYSYHSLKNLDLLKVSLP